MFRLLLGGLFACLFVGPGLAEEKTVKGWGSLVDPDGKAVTQQGKPVSEKNINLRVKRSGNKLTYSVSENGNWEDIHSEEVELPPRLHVGVLAINTTTKAFPAQFESLKLSAK